MNYIDKIKDMVIVYRIILLGEANVNREQIKIIVSEKDYKTLKEIDKIALEIITNKLTEKEGLEKVKEVLRKL
jgi:hypothetical protein